MSCKQGVVQTAGVGVIQPSFRRALRSQIVAQLQGQHVPQVQLELLFEQDVQDVDARTCNTTCTGETVPAVDRMGSCASLS